LTLTGTPPDPRAFDSHDDLTDLIGAATGGGAGVGAGAIMAGAIMTGARAGAGAGAGRSMASIEGCGADSLRAGDRGDLAAC